MSNIDKRALREVAEKATPGPWLWINTGSFFSFLVSESNQDPHQCIIDDGTAWGEYGETINPESPDGVFIAAANPAAVLALLDELEAKDKQIAELEVRTVSIPDYTELYKGPFAMEVEHQVKRALAAAGIRIAAAAGKGAK